MIMRAWEKTSWVGGLGGWGVGCGVAYEVDVDYGRNAAVAVEGGDYGSGDCFEERGDELEVPVPDDCCGEIADASDPFGGKFRVCEECFGLGHGEVGHYVG